MSSALRSLQRQALKINGRNIEPLETLLFGPWPAPTEAHKVERQRLITAFRKLLEEFQETSPPKLLRHIQEERRGYLPEVDGPSAVHRWLDEVRDLRDDEGTGRLVDVVVSGLRALG